MEYNHIPVLLDQCINNLNIKPYGIYVDGTLGGAGHSIQIIKKLNKNGKLIGIDKDAKALEVSKKRLNSYGNFIPVHGSDKDIAQILQNLNVSKVDGILYDLGVSSYQLDEPSRGFSYMNDAKLDMRMDQESKLSAYDVVNKYSEEDLEKIFFEYGQERYSKSVARNICSYRRKKSIDTTFELVDIIKKSMPGRALNEKQHPAKRVFQAIRVEVNGELFNLKQTIIDSIKLLNIKGRLLVISFESLEDRIVKHAYEQMQGKCTCPPDFPVCVCGYKSYGKIITKKPIVADEEELAKNPRARSAKLRVFERSEITNKR